VAVDVAQATQELTGLIIGADGAGGPGYRPGKGGRVQLAGATIRNAELLAMSGPRNPYPGWLGVVAEGAFADLILVDGDPIADISLIARPDEAFTVIIKDGHLIKGTGESR
jgi:hypothetical protein